MKVILLYVASVDGKLTRWGQTQVHEWTSPEDAAHFTKIRNENNLIVMGSNTYNAVQPQPEVGKLRIVITNHPEKFTHAAVSGQLEFTEETPEALIERLSQKGYKQMLLVSGRQLTSAFFAKGLVNEMWLTIEPRLFGTGDPLLTPKELDIQLQLLSKKQLNKQGTLLLQYAIVRP